MLLPVRLPLPLQPGLGEPAQDEFPYHSGLALHGGQDLSGLPRIHSGKIRNLPAGSRVALLLGSLFGDLDLGLEFGKDIGWHLSRFNRLGHAVGEPRQEALHRIGWVRRHASFRLAASLPPKSRSGRKPGPLGCRKAIPCRTTSPEAIALTTRPVS